MANNLNYNINFGVQNENKVVAAVSHVSAGLVNVEKGVFKVDNVFNKTINNITNRIKTIQLSSILDQVDRAATSFENLSKPGTNLSTSMADLSAITGVTGGKLKEIEGYARENAKAFGGDAAQSAESYKLILSQLNPEIAKVPTALKAMGENISILSKTMGGDTVAATEVLTTALNQYQVSTDDPIAASKEMASMMNIMAAAAKEGSAELPQIKQALEQSGMAAKTANVSFAETNAAIQVLDKAGKRGAEGGVALRNVMAILSEGRFLPREVKAELAAAGVNINTLGDRSLTLADRLKPLQKITGDAALMTKLFGRENMNAAIAVVSGISEIERYTGAIQNTTTATEQAAIVMESPAEKAKRLQAKIDDLKISVFNATGGWLSFAGTIGASVRDFSGFAPVIMWIVNGIKSWTVAQWLLNASLWANPITWIVVSIIALIGVIAYVIAKTEGWGQAWSHVVQLGQSLWNGFVLFVELKWLQTYNFLMSGIDLIRNAWYSLESLWDEAAANAGKGAIKQAADARIKEIETVKGELKKQVAAASVENDLARTSVKWKQDKKTDKAVAVFPSPATPVGLGGNSNNISAVAPMGNTKGAKGADGGSGAGKKTNDAIATGGTKNTTIHITIGKQIEHLVVQTTNGIKEGAEKIRDIIVDEMTRAIAMSQAISE